MYEQKEATLQMNRALLEKMETDPARYLCRVLAYSAGEDYLYLTMQKEEELELLSLDGVYECRIQDQDTENVCRGVIVERYLNKQGAVVKFKLKDGIYEKAIQ